MTKYTRSGQYEMTKIVLITATQSPVELNLAESWTEAAVYESVFESAMSGNVSFVDTNGLLQKYALGGGETVVIEWCTSGSDTPIYCEGIVYDLTGPAVLGEHSAAYTLHWASPEFIAAARKTTLTGHNDIVSNIAAAVHASIARKPPAHVKTKPIVAATSRNIEHIVFTGQNPIQAITMMADRAVSSTGTVGYIYYEDNKQFNFVAVEDLYAKQPITEFIYKGAPAYDDPNSGHEEQFNAYQDFEVAEANKFIDDVGDGQYGSSWGVLDINTKSFDVHVYKASDAFNEVNSLGTAATAKSGLDNSDGSDRLAIKYTVASRQHTQAVDAKMKLLKTNNFVVSIGVFGNSNLKVGDVAKATVPTRSTDGLTPGEVDNVSGNFLIAEIKHILTPKLYNQRIKLIKDGYEKVVS